MSRLAADKIGQELFSIVPFLAIVGGTGSIDSASNPPQNDEVIAIAGS
jgi:hypothetical protein